MTRERKHYRFMEAIRKLIRLALEEDIGSGDLTARAVPATATAEAKIVAKEPFVLSGAFLVPLILEEAKARAEFHGSFKEGDKIAKGTTLFTFKGNARDLLTVERTILNFLQRTCGVATQAARYKEALGPNKKVKLLDTRKTTPGFRILEKKAVKDGGLHNHRASLDTGILIKENHIRAAGSITEAIKALKGNVPPGMVIQVEVTNTAEAFEAITGGATGLLLDNFNPHSLKSAVREVRERHPEIFLEASGGITLQNLSEYAATGVDAISIGALTHSVKSVDLSMLFEFSGEHSA